MKRNKTKQNENERKYRKEMKGRKKIKKTTEKGRK